ncbi:MAG: helix-turn-helix domain-containing protein [Chloroflexota bacterium]|nr:helix-turn-helix domain-containing protein [Chloroflexota bacterium]
MSAQTIDRPAQTPRMLTIDEAAAVLRMHRVTVYRHVNGGRLPSVKVGGRRLVPAAELDKLLTPQAGR